MTATAQAEQDPAYCALRRAPSFLLVDSRAMKLVTWNVNSIRARTERVIPWLEENKPDVLIIA